MKVNAMESRDEGKGWCVLAALWCDQIRRRESLGAGELLLLVGHSRSECHEEVEEFRVQACVDKRS